MKQKIGVYICHCGGNISDYVDTTKVKEQIENAEEVALVKETMFACADSTQKEIVNDIKENELDGLVVASCSPKLHLYTFRNVAERAGLNPYNYAQANIREQCSWAHTDKPEEATGKAVRLVRSAIGKVKYSEALSQMELSAINAVLVIGAGVAGMRAAISLADMGSHVYLIEKSHFVGGHTARLGELFTTDESGQELVSQLYKEIKKRDKINLFTNAQVENLSGNIGNFQAEIVITPRYIKPDCDREKLKQAIHEYEKADIPDEFNYNLTKRKAIYLDYENACPNLPAINREHFNPGEDFMAKYGDCIDMSQQEERLPVKMGALLVTTGFEPYEPAEGEYGYKKSDRVVTLQQLKRLIELNKEKFIYKNREIRYVVFIYCVGSRQTEGVNQYCSRYCCTGAIHASFQLKKKFGPIKSYHLYRDIRTYGKQELMYEDASYQEDIFCKFDADSPPEVEQKNGQPIVKFNDLLFDNEEFEIEPDLVVLVTGMEPRKDSDVISNVLKIPVGTDKFFNEVHPQLRPVETIIDGIYIAGTSQGPKNIEESMNSALAASAKANALINSGKIELEPTVVKIDPEACEWCEKCAEVCPYTAITKDRDVSGKEIAVVNEAVCKGCGACAPVCPEDAIDIVGYTNEEVEAMIDSLIKEV